MIFTALDLGLLEYCLAFAVVFLAQIYGAVASGDGLIIQPALISMGVPANIAMANDTTGSAFAGITAGWVFHQNNITPYGAILWWLPGIFIGPVAGALILSSLPLWVLEFLVISSAIFGAGLVVYGFLSLAEIN